MEKKIILIIVMALAISAANGQNKWSLRTNAGIASGSTLVDGYYFSFDIGIPLTKYLEIAPTFSNAMMLPNTFIYNNWNLSSGITYGVETGGPRKEQEYLCNHPHTTGKLLLFREESLTIS